LILSELSIAKADAVPAKQIAPDTCRTSREPPQCDLNRRATRCRGLFAMHDLPLSASNSFHTHLPLEEVRKHRGRVRGGPTFIAMESAISIRSVAASHEARAAHRHSQRRRSDRLLALDRKADPHPQRASALPVQGRRQIDLLAPTCTPDRSSRKGRVSISRSNGQKDGIALNRSAI